MATEGKSQEIHVHEIPYDIRFDLCRILDPNNNWKKIAGRAGFTNDDIAVFALAIQRPGSSPCDEFLTNWGHRLPTISHFFNILVDLHLLREASLLKDLVPDKCLQRLPGYKKIMDNKHGPSDTDKSSKGGGQDGQSQSISSSGKADTELPIPPDPDEPPESENSNDLNKADSALKESLQKSSPYTGNKQFVPLKSEAEPQECSENQIRRQSSKDSLSTNQEVSFSGSSNQNRLDGSGGQFSLTNQNICHSEPVESLDTNTTTYRRDSGSVSSVYSQHSDIKSRNRAESIKEINVPHTAQGTKQTSADVFQIHPDQYFSSKELSQATEGFSTNRVIGQGSFGTTFAGFVRNTQVAIKKLSMWDGVSEVLKKFEESKPGILSLFRLQHSNIVRLYGCCLELESVCLVYEHLKMGSLFELLHKERTCSFPWQRRCGVLMGVAMGMQYLHEMGVFHGNIKSSNILLTQQFEAKLTDFGLTCHIAKQTDGKTTHVTVRDSKQHMYANKHYMPPEFFQSGFKLYPQTDVFSFGVVVYEMCTGQTAYCEKLDESLVDYMEEKLDLKDMSESYELKDSTVSDWPEACFIALLTLGKNCTVAKRKSRPSASQVHATLSNTLNMEQSRPLSSNATLQSEGSFKSDPGPRSLYEAPPPGEIQSLPSGGGSTTPDLASPPIGITSLPNTVVNKKSLGSNPNKMSDPTEHMANPVEHMYKSCEKMSNTTEQRSDTVNQTFNTSNNMSNSVKSEIRPDSVQDLNTNVEIFDDQTTPSCEEINIIKKKGKKKATIFEMYDQMDDEHPLCDSSDGYPLDTDGINETVSTTSGASWGGAINKAGNQSPTNAAIATGNVLAESTNDVSSSDDVAIATTLADDNKQHGPADSTVQDPNLSKIMRKKNLLMNEFDNADTPSIVHERAHRDDVTNSINEDLNEMLKQRCAIHKDRNEDACETVITSMNLNSPIMSTMCKDI